MEQEPIWTEFLTIARNPFTYLNDWKNQHPARIIGCLAMRFPEEVIHASGALPIVVPEGDDTITLGDAHIQTYICGYVRGSFDIALKGKLSFLDGWVFPDTCHSIRGLATIVERNIRPSFLKAVYFPAVIQNPCAKSFLRDQLADFKKALEDFVGVNITTDSMRNSIQVYNKNRALIRRLYAIRRVDPKTVSAKRMWAVVTSSMFMPKEEHSKLLDRLLSALTEKDAAADDKTRLLLSGSLCESVPVALLDLIEDLGAVVVDDDLYVGSRYVGEDADEIIDPLDALVARFLNASPPCPTRVDNIGDWADHLITMVRQAGAQGVVSVLAKYCEPHAMYYPYLAKRLKDEGIPELLLECEHANFPRGQYTTRLEAFLELVRSKQQTSV